MTSKNSERNGTEWKMLQSFFTIDQLAIGWKHARYRDKIEVRDARIAQRRIERRQRMPRVTNASSEEGLPWDKVCVRHESTSVPRKTPGASCTRGSGGSETPSLREVLFVSEPWRLRKERFELSPEEPDRATYEIPDSELRDSLHGFFSAHNEGKTTENTEQQHKIETELRKVVNERLHGLLLLSDHCGICTNLTRVKLAYSFPPFSFSSRVDLRIVKDLLHFQHDEHRQSVKRSRTGLHVRRGPSLCSGRHLERFWNMADNVRKKHPPSIWRVQRSFFLFLPLDFLELFVAIPVFPRFVRMAELRVDDRTGEEEVRGIGREHDRHVNVLQRFGQLAEIFVRSRAEREEIRT